VPMRWKALRKFLRAFSSLPPEVRSRCKVVFFTRTAEIVMEYGGVLVDEGVSMIHDYVPLDDIIAAIKSVDVCLLLDYSKLEVATKLLEYLACHKPVWALIPQKSSNARMIKRYKAGWVCDLEVDEDTIADSLVRVFNLWKKQCLPVPTIDPFRLSFASSKALVNRVLEG